MKKLALIFCIVAVISCKKEEDDPVVNPPSEEELYYPELIGNEWETISPLTLGWDTAAISNFCAYMEENDTRALIVLKDGKIVMEKYWGNDFLEIAPFTQNTNWYWASAAKTLTAFLVGTAQEDGLLDINDKTSDYLGENWTSMPLEKENLITVKHILTMTTGMEYNVADQNCFDPECLSYRADAGDHWFYHNACYTVLDSVVINASGMSFNDYTDAKVQSTAGVNGFWAYVENQNLYWSTARDAARFGLLLLGNGRWDETQVLGDQDYLNAMKNTSQDLNKSYGYLTWLNGKSSIIYPILPTTWNTSLSDAAPADLYAGIGKDGQIIDVVPSENLVVVRMGRNPDNSLVPVSFHNEMWEHLNLIRE